MDTTATNRKLREILSEISKENWILKPSFQRNLVWTAKHKNNIIRTVLMGYPFPEVFIATMDCDINTAESKIGIVDGQQRLSTLYSYFAGKNDFRLEKDITPYSKLSDQEKLNFLEYVVVVRDLGVIDDGEIREVFKRLNSTNYNLNAMEINHAIYDGHFRGLCERLASNEYFENSKIFTSNDIKRMNDSFYVATIISTILQGYFNNDEKIDDCFSMYNETFDKEYEIEREFIDILNFIAELDIESKRISQKADFFTLFVELYFAKFVKCVEFDKVRLREILKLFFDDVDALNDETNIEGDYMTDVKLYKDNIIQGTNHRSSRISRGKVLSKIIASATV